MSDILDERIDTGGKGYGLQRLEALPVEELDFKVPEYDIIPPKLFAEFQVGAEEANTAGRLRHLLGEKDPAQTFLPSGIEGLVRAYAEKYRGRKVQVRSNSKREGGSHSFRGRYDSVTVERVDEASLRAACWTVYKSLYSERAVEYRLENGISDDQMGIVIQEFVDGEWYGVVHTSKPDYPAALTINFAQQHGGVTDSADVPVETNEYVKTDDGPKLLYCSNNTSVDSKWGTRLARVAQQVEAELAYSELEFAIRGEDIYLLQHDALRNVQEPEPVEIPQYDPDAFLGQTFMAHGNGRATLPVVRIESLDDVLRKLIEGGAAIAKMEIGAPTLITNWISNIQRLDKRYSDGYILVTTHFNETMFDSYPSMALLGDIRIPHCNFDSLTPNKKMIVTTTNASPSSHAITVARERGTLYAGFQDKDGGKIFNSISTGELISAYFSEGKASLYKEPPPQKSITDFGITMDEPGELRLPVDSSAEVRSFGEALARELSALTSLNWSYHPSDTVVGGTLICERADYNTDLRGHRMHNQYTALRLDPAYVHIEMKPYIEEILQKLQ